MSPSELRIEAETKVAALLDRYPELEDVLIGVAPPFKKLKNPLLRKSVAKVASLRQAAAVARLPVRELVNTLRREVGQEPLPAGQIGEEEPYLTEQPAWFDPSKIVRRINELDVDPNTMPIKDVLQGASHLEAAQILVLETTHIPAPGIDILKKKGYQVWCVQEGEETIQTYIAR